MYNENPSLFFFEFFGCVTIMQIENPFCKKLDKKLKQRIIFGEVC